MLILCLSLREGQKYNVVIIAKRIHLFPYRTQKLSSLAAMVLGGQPPGRVARSHVVCRSGGTGRRTGLKILRDLPLVPVRFRSSAKKDRSVIEVWGIDSLSMSGCTSKTFFFIRNLKVVRLLFGALLYSCEYINLRRV